MVLDPAGLSSQWRTRVRTAEDRTREAWQPWRGWRHLSLDYAAKSLVSRVCSTVRRWNFAPLECRILLSPAPDEARQFVTTNMQFVGKLTAADLNDVPKDTRSKAHWRAMTPRAVVKLVVRCCAVLFAFASIAAVSIVGALSFGFYGAAMLLGRVRPLRDAYQFLSRTYDRFIDRLGKEVLRDPRDTPALRVMVSLSFTAVPIFVIQLLLGKPRLLLVIAFYLSLCGPKFQRSVRMFSAKHMEAHRPQGYFSEKYDKVFGRYVEFFLGYLYGDLPELGRTVHVRLHHKENGGPDDTVANSGYNRTSRLHFLWYLSDNAWTTLGLAPYAYFRARGDVKTKGECSGEWRGISFISERSFFTIGELGSGSCWFLFSP